MGFNGAASYSMGEAGINTESASHQDNKLHRIWSYAVSIVHPQTWAGISACCSQLLFIILKFFIIIFFGQTIQQMGS